MNIDVAADVMNAGIFDAVTVGILMIVAGFVMWGARRAVPAKANASAERRTHNLG